MEPAEPANEMVAEKADVPMEVEVEERINVLVFATDSTISLLSAETHESLGAQVFTEIKPESKVTHVKIC